MSGFSTSPPWRASVTHGGYPWSLCTGTTCKPRSASTQVNSLSEAGVQLHIMLHARCRLHAQTKKNHTHPIGLCRLAEVTTQFRGEKKTQTRGKASEIRAFPLSPHNKSTYFPKLSNAAGTSAATPTGTRHSLTGSKLRAAEASQRRDGLSSL